MTSLEYTDAVEKETAHIYKKLARFYPENWRALAL